MRKKRRDWTRRWTGATDPRTGLPRSRKSPCYRCVLMSVLPPMVDNRRSAGRQIAAESARAHAVSGIGSGRFSMAAAITSGNRSGVQANAGAPSAASAAACSRS